MKIGNQYSYIEVIAASCPKCDGSEGYPNNKFKYGLLCKKCDQLMTITNGKTKITFLGWITFVPVFLILFGILMSPFLLFL